MEHCPSTSFGEIVFKKLFLCLFLLFLTGCKKEHPNPEQLDPIYKAVSTEHSDTQKALDDEAKTLEQLTKDLEKAQKGTMDYVTAEKLHKNSKERLRKLVQKEKYLKIRVERRKVEGRRQYKLAFERSEVWPNPEEFKQYELSKKLQSVDLNWNKRVPKLDINNPNYKKNQK